MFLILVIVKSFMTTFYKNKRTCLKISKQIKNMFNSFISQMIILVCIIIHHVLKKYKENAHMIKKFENNFVINKWFKFRQKVTNLLIF